MVIIMENITVSIMGNMKSTDREKRAASWDVAHFIWEKSMKTIYNYLEEYSESDFYGMHMPGHKRNQKMMENDLPYEIDITEIDEFDDLHHADGIIREAQERAARLYGADETHFLVNGSTVGILSAIMGVTDKQDQILVARNCHKSVYHAIYLNELKPVYVYPEYDEKTGLNGEVRVDDITLLLDKNPNIKAVMIVSPTYDGVVSDVKKIAEVAHVHKIPLIVDEAHGAHFGFHPYFPKNANENGADIVIHSVHKTLPSLTQTALLHINETSVNREKVRMYLHMLQSSSPSYVLMASIDECMELIEKKGEDIFSPYVDNLQKMREELGKLSYLRLVETSHYDCSKFVISVRNTNISSRDLEKILRRKYHLQMEMTSGDYVLGMTAVGDTKEGLERFTQALLEIDRSLSAMNKQRVWRELPRTRLCAKSSDVLHKKRGKFCGWKESIGKISMEYAYLYPPGIPIIVPGEQITEDVIAYLEMYEQLGYSIEGLEVDKQIKVWINE